VSASATTAAHLAELAQRLETHVIALRARAEAMRAGIDEGADALAAGLRQPDDHDGAAPSWQDS
jgi:hypothetical protein